MIRICLDRPRILRICVSLNVFLVLGTFSTFGKCSEPLNPSGTFGPQMDICSLCYDLSIRR